MQCFFQILLIFALFSPLFASDEPFIFPSNTGLTGLMEIPTARVMREHSYRLGTTHVHPYRYYYGAISPFKGVEIEGGVTEVLGTKVKEPGWEHYGNYKDRVMGFKFQLLPEGKYSPAFAIGIRDPFGTRLYSTQYMVFSKQIYPFDFTFGLGNGRLGKRPLPELGEGLKIEMLQDPKGWFKDSKFFFGLQFAPTEKYAFMLEYSPIDFHKQTRDPAQPKYFTKSVPSRFNLGLRWKPFRWAEIDLSYQRGNQLGINLSTNFNIGKPLIPLYDSVPKVVEGEDFCEEITEALYLSGFRDVGVFFEGEDLWIEAENSKYYYTPRAIDVIAQILSQIKERRIENIHILLKNNGIPIVKYSMLKEDIDELFKGRLSYSEFQSLIKKDTEITRTSGVATRYRRSFTYGIRPSFQTYLDDPSGFFKYRFGLSGWFTFHPWQGSSFVFALEGYPLNTVSSALEPLSIPVRSDLVRYKRERIAVDKLLFEQIYKMSKGLFFRGAAGFLEVEYAGLDGEAAMPLLDGRLMVGLSGSIVKKREAKGILQLKKHDVKDYYSTAFFNVRFNFPQEELSFDLKTGRFLAGDMGTRITVSKFINGVILSLWYSYTDTSVFKDRFNRGYHDKGISITIPMRLFKGKDSKEIFAYTLSQWTRDVAQDIDHYNNLFDFIGRNTKIFLDRDAIKVLK